jgi:hypothetical protein
MNAHPFHFSSWLLPADLAFTPGQPISVELLPALRAQYPACLAAHVASIRLAATVLGTHIGGWCIWIAEHQPGQEGLSMRQVDDLTPITQDHGDGYNFGDQPTDEFPYPLLEAIFRPGQAPVVGETLGVFKPDALRMLREQIEFAQDHASHAAELTFNAARDRLLGQAQHHSDWAKLLAKALCQGIDLAGDAIKRLKTAMPLGLRDNEATSLWGEIVAEARQASLLDEGYRREVDQTVYEAFKALPPATQLAYWLLHSTGAREIEPGEDWDRPGSDPKAWDMFELESALERVARQVWAKADEEAFRHD